ncbi:MAG TPA: N,N-dimethylformamidase beta subunit family domain-containing protein [Acidimicrobiales bacterium]
MRRTNRRKRHRRLPAVTVGLGLALAVILSGCGESPTAASFSAPKVRPKTSPASTRPQKSSPATTASLGPDGVISSSVIAQNQLPGTTAWEIPPHTGPDGIEGFANVADPTAGTQVTLYVSTAATTFQVVAYRMGWYQGLGGHQVWQSPPTPGRVQPACPLTAGVNMVSCDNWTASLTIPITAAFAPGDYLLKLVGSTGQEGYVPLTVWDPSSHATYLIMNRTFTEEGWNAFGGYSYYQGEGPCTLGSGPYPVCNRARVVSFDRPYDTGDGASDFLSNEYPLIRFCEEHGLDVTYATDVTVDEHPTVLLQHKTLLSLGHDESWSNNERVAALTAQTKGMNIVFFGAAALVRHVRLQASPLGPDRQEVDYRDSSEDPLNGVGDPLLVTGNTWASPPTNWSEVGLVGELYSGYVTTGSAPFVVADASAWAFQGTGLRNGSSIPGLITSDIDHVSPGPPTPADLQVLGHSPIALNQVYTNQGKWGLVTYSDMTYYSEPDGGAGVLDTGDNNWINALTPCPRTVAHCPATEVAKITGNILRLFGQGPTGTNAPATSNLITILPPGS